MAVPPAPVIDSSKLLKAPDTFKGDEDKWLESSFIFKNCCLGLDAEMVANMNDIVTNGVFVPMGEMADPEQARSRNLLALLSSYCRDKAQRVLRNLKEPDS